MAALHLGCQRNGNKTTAAQESEKSCDGAKSRKCRRQDRQSGERYRGTEGGLCPSGYDRRCNRSDTENCSLGCWNRPAGVGCFGNGLHARPLTVSARTRHLNNWPLPPRQSAFSPAVVVRIQRLSPGIAMSAPSPLLPGSGPRPSPAIKATTVAPATQPVLSPPPNPVSRPAVDILRAPPSPPRTKSCLRLPHPQIHESINPSPPRPSASSAVH